MSELWSDHVSYSQLSSVEECPFGYYLQKIAGVEPIGNAFAEAGILAHKLLAGWAKGEIPINELSTLWNQLFPREVTTEFPAYLAAKGYREKLFESILAYLDSFTGFPGYEIVAAEQEFVSSIGDVKFIGVADLILRDIATGKLMIVDFKSCSLGSFKRSRDKMYKQLYLYAKHCADLLGEFPEKLRFELIKENTHDECLFSREEFMSARIWAETIIKEMKDKDITDWFDVRPEYFRCLNLCSCRNECAYGKPENHKRKENANGTKGTPVVA